MKRDIIARDQKRILVRLETSRTIPGDTKKIIKYEEWRYEEAYTSKVRHELVEGKHISNVEVFKSKNLSEAIQYFFKKK